MAPVDRIDSSAIASRSAVLTPGRTASRSGARVPATTRPAWRMRTICSGVLSSISSWCMGGPTSAAVGPQGVDRADGDVLDRAGGVDADQLALGAVEVDERRGVPGVDLEALRDRLGLVVVPLEEFATTAVADALAVGRVELDVPDLPAAAAGPPTGEPADDLLGLHDQ